MIIFKLFVFILPLVFPSTLLGLTGGPVGGYSYYDSNENQGPEYVWDEVYKNYDDGADSSDVFSDDMSDAVPIGFNFVFYGQTYSEIYVCSEGFITFTEAPLLSGSYGQQLPSNGERPNNLIAAVWDDLDPGG